MQTIQDLLREAAGKLGDSDTPRLDAEILLGHVLGQSREYCFSHLDAEVEAGVSSDYLALVHRRQQGEPVAYITGRRAFWDLDLAVTPKVLVPRPETELLVEAALELVEESAPARVADLGTGSGAIAISLARSRPHWQLIAVDIDAEALAVAQNNAGKYKITNMEFIQASWCDELGSGLMDLIVANPPYVAADDPHLQDGDLRFEPIVALQSGDAGYADLFAIASGARDHLKPGGWLLMEHGFEQHQRLCDKLQALGYTAIEGRKDLAGHWRMVQAQLPAS